MQINLKNYNSEFHNQLIEAAKNCDVSTLAKLINAETKAKVSLAQRLKDRRNLFSYCYNV